MSSVLGLKVTPKKAIFLFLTLFFNIFSILFVCNVFLAFDLTLLQILQLTD